MILWFDLIWNNKWKKVAKYISQNYQHSMRRLNKSYASFRRDKSFAEVISGLALLTIHEHIL